MSCCWTTIIIDDDDDGGGATVPPNDNTEVLVRINPVSGSHWRDNIIATFDGVNGFMLLKVESREELIILDEMLTNMERWEQWWSLDGLHRRCRHPRVLLWIAIETATLVPPAHA